MNDLEKQFRRVERAFEKVLNNRNRDLVEYEDDVWCFIQNCWHLKDWMQKDERSLRKSTRDRVDSDVQLFWKLVLIGDLANRSNHLRINDRETDEDVKTRELRIVSSPAKNSRTEGTEEPGEGLGEIVLVVTDNMKLEYPVRDLAKDAMRIWHKLFKVYGLNHLLNTK